MPKLPFDDIRPHADALLDKTLFAKNEEEAHEAYKVYVAYLEAVSWTPAEYDAEIAKRLDQMVPPESWDETEDPFKQPAPKKILN
jgi:hypothetical protein